MKRMFDDYPFECWKRYCLMETESAPSPSDFYVPLDIPQEIFQVFPHKVQGENAPEAKVKEQVPETSEPATQEDPVPSAPIAKPKEFYSGENGIIHLKKNVISIVDPTPRVLNQWQLAALKKPGTYFAQTKTTLFGPFSITPTPAELPKGELVMIYECCSSKFSETSTSCFRPVGLLQN